jgi:hypothetical protein
MESAVGADCATATTVPNKTAEAEQKLPSQNEAPYISPEIVSYLNLFDSQRSAEFLAKKPV